jgi:hypothetical protein
MRLLTIPAFISLCLSSQIGFAKSEQPLSPSEFSRRLVSATNWKKLFELADARLPMNIQKELADLSATSTLPELTFRRSELTLKDDNGTHLAIRFAADGKVFFNNTEWTPRPLSKTSDEVARIQDFIHSEGQLHRSMLDCLIPNAFALPNAGGVALAAHAATVGWKAESCGGATLSQEQLSSCPLMAVAMRSPALPNNPEEWVPISLSCPSPKDNGNFTLISENQNGEAQRIVLLYKSKAVAKVDAAVAPKNQPFDEKGKTSIDLTAPTSKPMQMLATMIINTTNSLNENVCDGPPEAKTRWDQSAKANRDALHKAAPDNFRPGIPGRSQQAI